MNTNLLQEAREKLMLESIFLRSSQHATHKDYISTTLRFDSAEFQFLHNPIEINEFESTQRQTERATKIFAFSHEFKARIFDRSEGATISSEPILEYSSLFVAQYFCWRENEPSVEALVEFGQQNVAFQLWPYWREHFQAVMLRSGMNAVAVPLFQQIGSWSVVPADTPIEKMKQPE